MSQQDKSRYFQALKDAGVTFSKHYREYTEAELKDAFNQMQDAIEAQAHAGPSPEPPELPIDGDLPSLGEILDMHRPDPEPTNPRDPGQLPEPDPVPTPDPDPAPAFDPAKLREAAAAFSTDSSPTVGERVAAELNRGTPPEQVAQIGQAPVAPLKDRDPNEQAGMRLNSKPLDEPLRTDEFGRVWYQEEVLKPAYPKPRGRRILRYKDRGTVEKTVSAGQFTETFEVPGDGPEQEVTVKITLPSYQVGLYKDKRFPFRIHTYNGKQGFNLFEVQDYYGGAELVPGSIRKVYVENVLCYDVRTTIRAIQEEFRQYQLAGRIKA